MTPVKYVFSGPYHKLQWRDLTGPEKIKLFKHIDLPEFFPNLPNVHKIHHLWMGFWRLITVLKGECDSVQLQLDIKEWVRKFLELYQTKNITPYVHAFACHVPEFVSHYGNITKFTQGLEKFDQTFPKEYKPQKLIGFEASSGKTESY